MVTRKGGQITSSQFKGRDVTKLVFHGEGIFSAGLFFLEIFGSMSILVGWPEGVSKPGEDSVQDVLQAGGDHRAVLAGDDSLPPTHGLSKESTPNNSAISLMAWQTQGVIPVRIPIKESLLLC